MSRACPAIDNEVICVVDMIACIRTRKGVIKLTDQG
jgi:hypothetical protein